MNTLQYTCETNKEEMKSHITKVKNIIMQRQHVCISVRQLVGKRNNITDYGHTLSSPCTKGVVGQHKLVATRQCSTQTAQYVGRKSD